MTHRASLAVCDPNYNAFVWTGVRTATTDWQQLTVTFTATGQGVARVHLAKHDTTGALLWDDVELAGGEYAISGPTMRYYPYGQEIGTATANDVAKFGTYTRDAGSGLDYAMNRYYMSTWGRFTTADPYRASAKTVNNPANPHSWNRYAYVLGDPVNLIDPRGLDARGPYFSCPFTDPEHWLDCEWIDGGDEIGPDGPAQKPVPLKCDFIGSTIEEPGWGTTDVTGYGYYTPVRFAFRASGGSGDYFWKNIQTVTHSGKVVYSSGKPIDLSRIPAGTESLSHEESGSDASFFDAPGIQATARDRRLGTIVSASIAWNFELRVSVSDGDQTTNCPAIKWSASQLWYPSLSGITVVGWVNVNSPTKP